ncbi:minor capsid protein [Vibrio owensii]|uniref:phage tail terminator protein n=1 Tax=Vibrio owensii TaxID=696485 RepID=UPI003397E7E4
MRVQDFLADKLVGASTDLDFDPIIGRTVFVGFLPGKITEGLLFTTNGQINKNHYTQLHEGTVQIVYRCSNAAKSARVMRQVTHALSGFEFGNLETDSVRILKFLARAEPLVYPRQESGLYEASVNFDVVCSFKETY